MIFSRWAKVVEFLVVQTNDNFVSHMYEQLIKLEETRVALSNSSISFSFVLALSSVKFSFISRIHLDYTFLFLIAFKHKWLTFSVFIARKTFLNSFCSFVIRCMHVIYVNNNFIVFIKLLCFSKAYFDGLLMEWTLKWNARTLNLKIRAMKTNVFVFTCFFLWIRC